MRFFNQGPVTCHGDTGARPGATLAGRRDGCVTSGRAPGSRLAALGRRPLPASLALDETMLLGMAWFDLLVEFLIATAVLLLGQAIARYEVFTGKALPRRELCASGGMP